MLFHQTNRFFKVLFDISPEVKDAPRFEDPLDIGDQGRSHHSSPAMPFFPPWVGKVNMNRDGAIVRQQFAEKLESISRNHLRISAFFLSQPISCEASVLSGDLVADEVSVRNAARLVEDEKPLATADFDFKILPKRE